VRAGVIPGTKNPHTTTAHHGWAGYLSEEFELTGTLEAPVSVVNPHASMKIRVDGQVWDVVLAPPARTARAGLREGIIPVGAQVTVHGHRHRDPKRFEIYHDSTFSITQRPPVFRILNCHRRDSVRGSLLPILVT